MAKNSEGKSRREILTRGLAGALGLAVGRGDTPEINPPPQQESTIKKTDHRDDAHQPSVEYGELTVSPALDSHREFITETIMNKQDEFFAQFNSRILPIIQKELHKKYGYLPNPLHIDIRFEKIEYTFIPLKDAARAPLDIARAETAYADAAEYWNHPKLLKIRPKIHVPKEPLDIENYTRPLSSTDPQIDVWVIDDTVVKVEYNTNIPVGGLTEIMNFQQYADASESQATRSFTLQADGSLEWTQDPIEWALNKFRPGDPEASKIFCEELLHAQLAEVAGREMNRAISKNSQGVFTRDIKKMDKIGQREEAVVHAIALAWYEQYRAKTGKPATKEELNAIASKIAHPGVAAIYHNFPDHSSQTMKNLLDDLIERPELIDRYLP